MKKVHRINNLEQVRLLADPLKLELLKVFAEAPRTAADAATLLGEKVTRLYRHIDALADAGLVEVVAETPKRGTVERTFRATAARFEVDHALFAAGSDDDAIGAVRDMLRAGEREILDVLSQPDFDADEAVILRLHVKATPARLAELRERLVDWLADLEQEPDAPDDAETREAGALVAFYPLRR